MESFGDFAFRRELEAGPLLLRARLLKNSSKEKSVKPSHMKAKTSRIHIYNYKYKQVYHYHRIYSLSKIVTAEKATPSKVRCKEEQSGGTVD